MRGAPQHYLVLGLDRRATPPQIRAAYVRLVKAHYAQQQSGGPLDRRIEHLQQAYRCLSDAERRATYDQLLDQLAHDHNSEMKRVQRRLRRADRAPARPRRPAGTRKRVILVAVLGAAAFVAGHLLAP